VLAINQHMILMLKQTRRTRLSGGLDYVEEKRNQPVLCGGRRLGHKHTAEPAMLIRIKPPLFPSRAEMIRAVDLLRERIVAGTWPEYTPPAKVKRAEGVEKQRLNAEKEAATEADEE